MNNEQARESGQAQQQPRKRKCGRKNRQEQEEHDGLMKQFMAQFFTDSSCAALKSFCRFNKIMELYQGLYRAVQGNSTLKRISEGQLRRQSQHQDEALSLIEQRYPENAEENV